MAVKDRNKNPELILVQTDKDWHRLTSDGLDGFNYNDITVKLEAGLRGMKASVQSEVTELKRIVLKWRTDLPENARFYGDHWERSYGDLEWRGFASERTMPWYFMVAFSDQIIGYGVKTSPNAMCSWTVNSQWVTLCLDVRCGGIGVKLGGRNLEMAEIVCLEYKRISEFTAMQQFCKAMCDSPRLPETPIYGGNNWYYAYGESSHKEIIKDARLIASLSCSGTNRPFMIIDDGWQLCHHKGFNGGPWAWGNSKFENMQRLAEEMQRIGTRPGIWFRPLLTVEKIKKEFTLPKERFKNSENGVFMDPSLPEVLEIIKRDTRRLVDWGYELIKHDFTTYDLFGRWGFEMGMDITNEGWHFSDTSRTSAEIINSLYIAIKEAAGNAVVIGCNTLSHLAAGHFQIQRTGDDTSGLQWERTRKMGINTLAFRMPQHNNFYAVDADCVGITAKIPWALNSQWLELLSKSGTPLFVSISPKHANAEHKKALEKAFHYASQSREVAVPVDWLGNNCPGKWMIDGELVRFDWHPLEPEQCK